MTPMPANPIVVLLVNECGTVVNDRNNIGNDLKIVSTTTQKEFDEASAGIPYIGGSERSVAANRQTLAGKRK